MSLHDAKHVQYSVTVWASDWVPYPYKWTHGCMVTQPANAISKVALCAWADGKTNEKVKIPPNFVPCELACRRLLFPLLCPTGLFNRGGSRIFFRRGCTRLLLYFNTNKPHSFFLQNTSCNTENRRSSQGGGGAHPCTLPLDPPLFNQWKERKYWTVPCERMSAQSDFSGSRKFDRHSRLRYRTRERQSCCEKKAGYSR